MNLEELNIIPGNLVTQCELYERNKTTKSINFEINIEFDVIINGETDRYVNNYPRLKITPDDIIIRRDRSDEFVRKFSDYECNFKSMDVVFDNPANGTSQTYKLRLTPNNEEYFNNILAFIDNTINELVSVLQENPRSLHNLFIMYKDAKFKITDVYFTRVDGDPDVQYNAFNIAYLIVYKGLNYIEV